MCDKLEKNNNIAKLSFCYRLEIALKLAVEEKEKMEEQLSELGQKIENLENGKCFVML